MTNKYSMQEFIKIFAEHAVKGRESNVKLLKDFIENNPNEPIPEWFLDDFSLPIALKSICLEILALKRKK